MPMLKVEDNAVIEIKTNNIETSLFNKFAKTTISIAR